MNYDLMNAESYARSAPGFLKSARERGDANAAAEQERRIAWANGVLAQHGKPLIPGGAAAAPPAPAPAETAAPSTTPAAATPWDDVTAGLNRRHGFAPAPGAASPPQPSPEANHGWDGVMAKVSAEGTKGTEPAGAAWSDVMASVNAESGASRGEA